MGLISRVSSRTYRNLILHQKIKKTWLTSAKTTTNTTKLTTSQSKHQAEPAQSRSATIPQFPRIKNREPTRIVQKLLPSWKRKTQDQIPNEARIVIVDTVRDRIQVAGKQRHRWRGKAEKPRSKVSIQPLNNNQSYRKKTTSLEALHTETEPLKTRKATDTEW